MQSIRADAPSAPDGAPVDPTSVYRYYDRYGLLVYVGITKQGMGRNLQHNSRAEWWPFVVRQEIDHLPSRAAALARERELIRLYRPPFNRQHNIGHEDLRTAYLALSAHAGTSGTVEEEYLSLRPGGTRGKRARPGWRWLPVEVLGRSGDSVTFRSGLGHIALARALRCPPSGAPVFNTCGAVAATVDRLERVGSFTIFHCVGASPVPREVTTAQAAIKLRDRGGPQVLRLILDDEGAGGRMR